jgi:5'-methylthioadenosine phosphorylase
MARLALSGSYYNLSDLAILAAGERIEVDVSGRVVPLLDCGNFVFLPRHGMEHYIPPHEIDHVANLRALDQLGCDRILAIGSVGSCDPEIGVGAIVCPDDFIALGVGMSAFDDERGHRVPGFHDGWRRHVIASWREWASAELRTGGVYWQTVGPRLETPAEIRLIADHAQLVGMTIASECVIAGELHIRYAAVCMVDNLANGIDKHLTMERLDAGRAGNRETLDEAMKAVVPPLAEEVRTEGEVPDLAHPVPHFHRERASAPEGSGTA